MSLRPEEFAFLSNLLKQRSGLSLTEDKMYLVESRLLPIARGQSMQDIAELCARLRTRPDENLVTEVIEAMTTNESSFFRDIKPYEQLRQIALPMVMEKAAASKRIRFWSAACSTGQEPYSVAICLEEDKAKMPGWQFEIVASDLAMKVINKAKSGIYSQFEAQRGLPIQMLVKYFTSLPDTSWQLKETIRDKVQFRQQNLLEDYSLLGKFDIVFCRNVLIYFDEPTKAQVTDKMARVLQPHGLLIIGSTESLVDPKGQFQALDEFRGAYKLKGA